MSMNINENDFIDETLLLSITEFAELVQMTAETLQHYDRKGVFQPAKTGVRFKNQYRYYSPTQITAVNMIRVLTEIGVPLDTIKTYADGDRTPELLMKLLNKLKDILTNKLNFIQESHLLISTQLELLNRHRKRGLCYRNDRNTDYFGRRK